MTERPPLAVLSGVCVLSFTEFLLGPSRVQFLADLGADVLRSIWAAPVLTFAKALAEPAVEAAGAIEEIDHPVAGRVRVLGRPLELSTGRATVRRPQPAPGQHSEEILREYGYLDDAICRFRDAGVV